MLKNPLQVGRSETGTISRCLIHGKVNAILMLLAVLALLLLRSGAEAFSANILAIQASGLFFHEEPVGKLRTIPLDYMQVDVLGFTRLKLIGSVLLKRGHVDEAITLLARAAQLRPHDQLAHFQLGLAYRENGRDQDAIAEWSISHAAPYFYHLGLRYRDTGDYPAAEQSELIAVTIDHQLVSSYEALVSIYWGRRERAVWALDQIISLTYEEKTYRNAYARARRAYLNGHWEDAVALFDSVSKRMLDRDPQLIWLYLFWGDSEMQLGHLRRAEEYYSEAMRIQPGNLWVYRGLGETKYLEGDYAGSARLYTAAIRVAPTWADGYARLAVILNRLGCPVPALGAAKAALEMDRESEPYGQLVSSMERNAGLLSSSDCVEWESLR